MPRFSPPRLLPSVIGAMSLLLAVKATVLVREALNVTDTAAALRGMLGSIVIAQSAVASPTQAEVPSAPPPAAPPPPGPVQREAPEAALLAELSVAEDLRARRLALEERERGSANREAMLAAAERRLAGRAEELSALRAQLAAQEKAMEERDEAAWRGIVKLYESMRPRDAATIFDELDMAVLVEVAARMREAKAAPVLAAMQPEKARSLTQELAKRRTGSRPAGG